MTTTTAPPATSEALAFYGTALPAIEVLCALARAWRDREPADPEATQAHSECVWWAIRCDIRLTRQRELTAEQNTGAGRARRTATPGAKARW